MKLKNLLIVALLVFATLFIACDGSSKKNKRDKKDRTEKQKLQSLESLILEFQNIAERGDAEEFVSFAQKIDRAYPEDHKEWTSELFDLCVEAGEIFANNASEEEIMKMYELMDEDEEGSYYDDEDEYYYEDEDEYYYDDEDEYYYDDEDEYYYEDEDEYYY